MRPRRHRVFSFPLMCLLHSVSVACAAHHEPATTPVSQAEDPKNITELTGYRTYDVNDTVFQGQVHVREAGPATAPAILLLHGIGENGARDFFPILPALTQSNHVYAVDLPGFGRSTRGTDLYSPDNYVRVLHAVVRPRIRSAFALVGHSMGGAIALEYAHLYPDDVTKLALIDTAGILHRSALVPLVAQTGIGCLFEPAQGLVGTLTGIIVDRASSPEGLLENDFTRSHVLARPNQIAAASLILHNFGAAIAELRTESLIVWGRHDGIAPLRTAKLLASRLPNAKLVILEQSGHVPMDTEPEALALVLSDWLKAPRATALIEPASAPRVGRCDKSDGMQFEGEYSRISIAQCHDVRVRNVRAEAIQVWDSDVVVEGTRLNSPDVALLAARSRLELTGCVVVGQVAVRLDKSELDVAGTNSTGNLAAVQTVGASRILFSASSITSPVQHRYMHDIVELAALQGM
jgi:pimeloyl-ACP methyl ester carboxylesterase